MLLTEDLPRPYTVGSLLVTQATVWMGCLAELVQGLPGGLGSRQPMSTYLTSTGAFFWLQSQPHYSRNKCNGKAAQSCQNPLRNVQGSWVLMAHACNPSYLGGCDQKWTGGMPQVVECLLCNSERLCSKPRPRERERERERRCWGNWMQEKKG
jgi:hypothetical protein